MQTPKHGVATVNSAGVIVITEARSLGQPGADTLVVLTELACADVAGGALGVVVAFRRDLALLVVADLTNRASGVALALGQGRGGQAGSVAVLALLALAVQDTGTLWFADAFLASVALSPCLALRVALA